MASSSTSKNDSKTVEFAASDYSASRRIRDYVLLEKLGEGGMGEVYKALHSRLGKTVALKILARQRTTDPQSVARFEREMLAIGRFSHPNIVSAFDAGEFDGTHFLVMEYVAGCDLANIIGGTGPLPIPDACEIIVQAANALQHVFNHGLVHRDIKPSNLMLTADGTVKILDLGLALLQDHTGNDTGELTAAGQTMGTIDYIAPEQCGDSHAVDIRADIYSLGATLYKLLAGRAPYATTALDTPIKKLTAIATSNPQPLQVLRPDVPAPLSAIVQRMMAKEPGERFARPIEVAEALKPWAEGSSLTNLFDKAGLAVQSESSTVDTTVALKTVPYASSVTDRKKLFSRSRLAILAAIIAVPLVAIVAFFARHKSRESDPKSTPAVADTKSSTAQAQSMGSPAHELAAQILEKHGHIKLQVGNAIFELSEKSQLPATYLPIVAIDLADVQLDNADLVQIGNLAELRSLSLRSVPINDAAVQPLSNLASLEELTLSGSSISDASLIHLAALAHLKNLSLAGTNVTIPGIAKLREALPNCWITSPQTLNLLTLVNVSRDAVLGQWQTEDGPSGPELKSPDGQPGRLQIPFHPPREYMLRAVLTRTSDLPRHNELCITFPHSSSQPQANIDSWDLSNNRYISGLQIIDAKLVFDRPSAHEGQLLPHRKPATLLFVATDRGFAVSCDGKLVDEHWDGYANVVRNGNLSIPDVKAIAFETDRCEFHFTSLDLTPLAAGGESENIWPVTPDFRAAAWACRTMRGEKPGEFKGPIQDGKKPIDGRPIWELSQRKFNVHSINVAGRTHVTDIGLKHLAGISELEELDLSNTQVTDAGLAHLTNIESLKKIDLSGTRVTHAGVDKLKTALPDCEVIWNE